jgi:hypothetical protein
VEALDQLLSANDWVAVGDLPGLAMEYVDGDHGGWVTLPFIKRPTPDSCFFSFSRRSDQISLATVLYDTHLVFKRPATEEELEDAAFAGADEDDE